MIRDEQLISLFRAFSERQDVTFQKVAEAIISDELASNHHSMATELRKALSGPHQTTSLPKDRRNGEHLIIYRESSVSQDQVVLTRACWLRIERILEEYRNRHLLGQHGYQPMRKLLFWGPPGCGKTFTADFIAHELGMPIGTIRLNAVISSFLGDTAAHLQRVFDLAENRSMVLLLDEIDAVAKNRDDRNDVGELKRVVNSLLQAMDEFRSKESILIAASNHQYLLDPAVWRRFDEIVHFAMPAEPERQQYAGLLLNGVSFRGSISHISKSLASLSFGDINKVIVNAIKSMILRGKDSLCSEDITKSLKSYREGLFSAKRRPRAVETGTGEDEP
jgi:AAA+ superfamily predicted ATPase